MKFLNSSQDRKTNSFVRFLGRICGSTILFRDLLTFTRYTDIPTAKLYITSGGIHIFHYFWEHNSLMDIWVFLRDFFNFCQLMQMKCIYIDYYSLICSKQNCCNSSFFLLFIHHIVSYEKRIITKLFLINQNNLQKFNS